MRWLPGLQLLTRYEAAWFPRDLMAGLVLTTMLVPVGIAYAVASGVPGIYGLYATIVPLLAYALFGPSRILVLGPDSSLAPVILAVVLPVTGGDPHRAVTVASLMAVVSGLVCISIGALRLGLFAVGAVFLTRSLRGEPHLFLQGFVPNEGDAWRYTLDQVKHYFERALARSAQEEVPVPAADLLLLTDQDPPPLVGEMLGEYIESARLLGRRTAELHLALASVADDPVFAPEPFTTLYQRSLYQSMRNLTAAVFQLLRERRLLPLSVSEVAEKEATRQLSFTIRKSMSAADLSRAHCLEVDLVGVRGAACDGGRSGTVSAARVRELKAALGLRPAASRAPVAH